MGIPSPRPERSIKVKESITFKSDAPAPLIHRWSCSWRPRNLWGHQLLSPARHPRRGHRWDDASGRGSGAAVARQHAINELGEVAGSVSLQSG